MTIIQFPGKFKQPPPRPQQQAPKRAAPRPGGACGKPKAKEGIANKAIRLVLSVIWCLCMLTWPLPQWVLSMDVFFQFLRMLYYSTTPGMHAGWTFTMHFAFMIGFYFFIFFYKPAWR